MSSPAEDVRRAFETIRDAPDPPLVRCLHELAILHPADARELDGKPCPLGCGVVLRCPA